MTRYIAQPIIQPLQMISHSILQLLALTPLCRPKWGGSGTDRNGNSGSGNGWSIPTPKPCITHISASACSESPVGCRWNDKKHRCDMRDCGTFHSKYTCEANSNCNWGDQPTTSTKTPNLFSTTTTPQKHMPNKCVEVDCRKLSELEELCSARSNCVWDRGDGGSCGKKSCDMAVTEVKIYVPHFCLLSLCPESCPNTFGAA